MKHVITSYVVTSEGEEVAGGPRIFRNAVAAFAYIFGLVFDAITSGSEIIFTDSNPDSLTYNCKVGLQYKEEE